MLPITFFRSSLINNLNFCEHQCFLTYVLGLYQKSNIKSECGTIVHKVLELLALAKKHLQTSPEFHLKDETIDIDILINADVLLKPTFLTNAEVDKINSTRINKDVYKWDCNLNYNHVRFGKDLVEYLIDKCYKYYSANSPNKWEPIHFKQVTNFVWILLDYQNGKFDPRNQNVFSTETYFDLEIDEPWAKYHYPYRGKDLKGHLRLKGTIDLTLQLDDNTLEFVDYKGLAIDTKLPTPTGWTTMGEVQIGDILFDIDGQQTKVLGKSKVKNLPCYKITFNDNSYVICDNEHLWMLNDNSIVSMTQLKIGDKISYNRPINCDDVELPIDPYELGLSLRHNDMIPDVYLRSSIEQRRELLTGLRHSIGLHMFDSIPNIQELMLSLGDNIPFNNFIDACYYRTITSIEKIPSIPTQCIMVDSPTHTFLCTEKFIPTHNTGQRLDWNSGEIKTYKKLHLDNQLLTYYYAGKKLYPNKNIVVSIFFIRDGGPYSICFDENDYNKAIQLFKNTFDRLQQCDLPILLDPTQKNFKCNRICDYYKQPMGDTNTCKFLHNEIQKHGIDYVIDNYTKDGFEVGTYEAPGGTD